MIAPSVAEPTATRTRPAAIPGSDLTARTMLAFNVSPASLDPGQRAGDGLRRLLTFLCNHDSALYEHSLTVWAFTRHLARTLTVTAEEQRFVELAALLHDVGKLALPRTLLDKPTRLSHEDYQTLQPHSAIGARVLEQQGIDAHIVTMVAHHHERWDGQGYPDSLAGRAIPRGARLIAIADAIAAMTAPRPYREACSLQGALRELRRCAGTQFDPVLARLAMTRFTQGGQR